MSTEGGFADLPTMEITEQEFDRIARLVQTRTGIALTRQKRALVLGRLQPLLHSRGITSFTQYMDGVEGDASGRELSELVSRLSTNHTHFFREPEHFRFFAATVLPRVLDDMESRKDFDLRIWCAACATGEEAYTLQMLVMEHLGAGYGRYDGGLLATDISLRALETARRGIYGKDSIIPLPPVLRQKYFLPGDDDDGVRVHEKVRSEITFRRFNLSRTRFPFNKPFHVIFCRNVMIYFNQETRAELIGKFVANLVPGGWLFVGHSESIHPLVPELEYIQPAVYRRRPR